MTRILFLAAIFSFSSAEAFNRTSDLTAPFRLPGAPVAGSVTDVSDYQQVLEFQNTRTPEDCARATSEVKISLASFYGAPYGPLTDAEVSHWDLFFVSLAVEAGPTIGLAKNQWQRPRPFVTHSDIHPCVHMDTSFSYPSGHATLAEFYAKALEIAFPERAPQLKARALQIALDRSIGGVHYPSDIHDGNLLGDQIYDWENKDGALENRIRQHH